MELNRRPPEIPPVPGRVDPSISDAQPEGHVDPVDIARSAGGITILGIRPGDAAPDITRPAARFHADTGERGSPPLRRDGQPLVTRTSDGRAARARPSDVSTDAPRAARPDAPSEARQRHTDVPRRGMGPPGEPPAEPPRAANGGETSGGGGDIAVPVERPVDITARVEIDGSLVEVGIRVPTYTDRMLSPEKLTTVGEAADADITAYNYMMSHTTRMYDEGTADGGVILAVHCSPDKQSWIADPVEDDKKSYNLKDSRVMGPDGLLGMMPRKSGIEALSDAISGGDDNLGNAVESVLEEACRVLEAGKMNQATGKPEPVLPPLGQVKDAVRVMIGNARTGTAPGVPNDVPNLTVEQVDEIKRLVGGTELDSIKPHLPVIHQWLKRHSVDVPVREDVGSELELSPVEPRIPGAPTVINSTVGGTGRMLRAQLKLQTDLTLKAIDAGITEGSVKVVIVTDADLATDPEFIRQLDAMCRNKIPLFLSLSRLTDETAALGAGGDWAVSTRDPGELSVLSRVLGEKVRHDITSTGGALHGTTNAGVHGGDGYTHDKTKPKPEQATTSSTYDDGRGTTADWQEGVTIGIGPKYRTVDIKVRPGESFMVRPGDDVGFVYDLESRQFRGYLPPPQPQPTDFLRSVLKIANEERVMREQGLAGAHRTGIGGGVRAETEAIGRHPDPVLAIEGARVRPLLQQQGGRPKTVHDRPGQLKIPDLGPPRQEFQGLLMGYSHATGQNMMDGRVTSAAKIHFLQWMHGKYRDDVAEETTGARSFALYANRRGATEWLFRYGIQAGVVSEYELRELRQRLAARGR